MAIYPNGCSWLELKAKGGGGVDAEVLVVGAGLAGLSVAFGLARQGVAVRLVAKADHTTSNSYLAQGGVAGAYAPSDHPRLHAEDTVRVGRELSYRPVVEMVTAQAPALLSALLPYQLFAVDEEGRPHLDREAGHSHSRIWHAPDGFTGRALTQWLWQQVNREPLVTVERGRVLQLLVKEGQVVGAWVMTPQGIFPRRAAHTVLATGGMAGLWPFTTNPETTAGDGLWLAFEAGAVLADLEFIQFHPTVLAWEGRRPAQLLTEALRGFGAQLVDRQGRRIMADHPEQELAPRDEVARAVGERDTVYLTLRHLDPEEVHHHFRALAATLSEMGLDLARDLLPVRPGAHFTMGGVLTDPFGRTSLPGLWAVGEVAATGLHGANRLASNSLLEGMVFGGRAAEAIGRAPRLATPAAPLGPAPDPARWEVPPELPEWLDRALSVFRDPEVMASCSGWLSRTAGQRAAEGLAQLVLEAAQARRESRGAHFRADAPRPSARYRGHFLHHRERGMWFAPHPEPYASGIPGLNQLALGWS